MSLADKGLMEPEANKQAKHIVLHHELLRLDREVEEYRTFLSEIRGASTEDSAKEHGIPSPSLVEVLETAPEQIAIAIKDLQAILIDLREALFLKRKPDHEWNDKN